MISLFGEDDMEAACLRLEVVMVVVEAGGGGSVPTATSRPLWLPFFTRQYWDPSLEDGVSILEFCGYIYHPFSCH